MFKRKTPDIIVLLNNLYKVHIEKINIREKNYYLIFKPVFDSEMFGDFGEMKLLVNTVFTSISDVGKFLEGNEKKIKGKIAEETVKEEKL